jgi:NosR/NirI family transcriptional regulator, nitrite reductase regulator
MAGDPTPSRRLSHAKPLCRYRIMATWAALSAIFQYVAMVWLAFAAHAQPMAQQPPPPPRTAPEASVVATLFPNAAGPLQVTRHDGTPPSWHVFSDGRLIGYIASTSEVAGSVGYSGRPIDILIGVSIEARITGAHLIQHNEPILTLGISSADIARYVSAFSGYDLTSTKVDAFKDNSALPPIIARATVSTGVIRDGILRTARTVALGHGLTSAKSAGIDRAAFQPRTWSDLSRDGSLVRTTMTFKEAAQSFGPISNPLPADDGAFIDLWLAVLDPPTIGQNLLGQQAYTRVMGALGATDTAIFVASSGLHSHRGTAYQTRGVFDRLEVIQGSKTFKLRKEDYQRIAKLAVADAPVFNEISAFRLSAADGFVASEPFRLEVSGEREREDGSIASLKIPAGYTLPKTYAVAQAAEMPATEEPLWVAAWKRKPVIIGIVMLMTLCVATAFFAQEWFVRRPQLWLWSRTGFLLVTLAFLGWYANGQLSVVQVVAFFHSLLNGFRWETFLIEPVIFVLWSFVALGLLFWGRGVFCGWLCPFGALHELTNKAAKAMGVRQIEVPFAVQERLWAIKYTLFMAILGLSFYSMEHALVLAEVEPFKTAISMRFMRDWPFVLFVVAILGAGLFIERFYCRYLCPLGAALAIPAKMKLFDWLHRRPQCGRECRFCETQCTVGAIDTLGRINPNECILCLRCQVIMCDPAQCIALKRRAVRGEGAGVSAPAPAASRPPA